MPSGRPKTLAPDPCPVCDGPVVTAWGYNTRTQCCSKRCRQILFRRRKAEQLDALIEACEAVRDAFPGPHGDGTPQGDALAKVHAALALDVRAYDPRPAEGTAA